MQIIEHTVRLGSTLAASMAIFIASIEGFNITGISSGRVALERLKFIVSKQIICSKQSVIPRRSNAFIAWTRSEFVKICTFTFKISSTKSKLTYQNSNYQITIWTLMSFLHNNNNITRAIPQVGLGMGRIVCMHTLPLWSKIEISLKRSTM